MQDIALQYFKDGHFCCNNTLVGVLGREGEAGAVKFKMTEVGIGIVKFEKKFSDSTTLVNETLLSAWI